MGRSVMVIKKSGGQVILIKREDLTIIIKRKGA
jgi:hypothetical protein